jgi:hypothetical protein
MLSIKKEKQPMLVAFSFLKEQPISKLTFKKKFGGF